MAILEKTGATLKSSAKILLQSRPGGWGRRGSDPTTVYVLGNGPSLKDALAAHASELAGVKTLAVNFALNSPLIRELRPKIYVLADPHFFAGKGADPKVCELWDNLAQVFWPMRLYVPAPETSRARKLLGENKSVKIKAFNAVGVEGFAAFEHAAYALGLGMPRPRNVLIPSIMIAIREGARKVVLLGADHSWMRTLAVSDENEVVSIQEHFYKDDARELRRVRSEYGNYRLHQIVESFAVAFRAYHRIAAFAHKTGVDIVNATPGSFIDAFRREPLSF